MKIISRVSSNRQPYKSTLEGRRQQCPHIASGSICTNARQLGEQFEQYQIASLSNCLTYPLSDITYPPPAQQFRPIMPSSMRQFQNPINCEDGNVISQLDIAYHDCPVNNGYMRWIGASGDGKQQVSGSGEPESGGRDFMWGCYCFETGHIP